MNIEKCPPPTKVVPSASPYHLVRASGSFARRKTPPIPVTFAMRGSIETGVQMNQTVHTTANSLKFTYLLSSARLIHGEFSGRVSLKAIVGDHATAQSRETVCSRLEALLGPIDRREALAEPRDDRVVEALGNQGLGCVAHVPGVVYRFAVGFAFALQFIEEALNPGSFGVEQLRGPIIVHSHSLSLRHTNTQSCEPRANLWFRRDLRLQTRRTLSCHPPCGAES